MCQVEISFEMMAFDGQENDRDETEKYSHCVILPFKLYLHSQLTGDTIRDLNLNTRTYKGSDEIKLKLCCITYPYLPSVLSGGYRNE